MRPEKIMLFPVLILNSTYYAEFVANFSLRFNTTIVLRSLRFRMVLEPKTGAQCDYGSFEDTRPPQDPVAAGPEEAAGEGVAVAEESTEGFLSQQPLLLNEQEWAHKYQTSAPSPRRPNGTVKIDMPPPGGARDKPHFPKEKLKTLLGELENWNYDYAFALEFYAMNYLICDTQEFMRFYWLIRCA